MSPRGVTTWRVRERAGCKLIHRSTCRYATTAPVYGVLDACPTARSVVQALRGQAIAWHIGCRFCAADVDDALNAARRELRGPL